MIGTNKEIMLGAGAIRQLLEISNETLVEIFPSNGRLDISAATSRTKWFDVYCMLRECRWTLGMGSTRRE